MLGIPLRAPRGRAEGGLAKKNPLAPPIALFYRNKNSEAGFGKERVFASENALEWGLTFPKKGLQ